jgi:O-antigen/teichoic acid export membrane protein
MIQGFFPAVEMAVVAAVLAITRDLVTSLQCYIVAGFALEAYIFRKIAAGTSFRSIRTKINVRVFRDYLVYSLPLIPGGFNLLIISSGDRFIIGYLLDPEAVGYYSIAYALASAVLLFNAPVMNSLFPKVAKAYTENDCSGVRRSIRKGMKAYLFAGGVLFLFLLFFGEYLFHLLSGRKGLPGEFSGNAITMLVLVSLIVYGLSRIYSLHLYVQNRTNALFTIYFFGTVVNIGFNIILVKYLGLIGAALATLASYSVMAGLISYFVNRSSSTASQTA